MPLHIIRAATRYYWPARRLGRWLLWNRPVAYRRLGMFFGRGDCLREDYDFWIGGYPRSGNTFCAELFQLANPSACVRTHFHIPPHIIHALAIAKPGLFLIRRPADAVTSWAIFCDTGLVACLNYYVDFHNCLKPYLPEMLVACFEDVTHSFHEVVPSVNRRFGTSFEAVAPNASVTRECFTRMESSWFPDGPVNERTVCRPSAARQPIKAKLIEALESSPRLRAKLEQATELFEEISGCSVLRQKKSVPADEVFTPELLMAR